MGGSEQASPPRPLGRPFDGLRAPSSPFLQGPLYNCRSHQLYHLEHLTPAPPLILREPQHERPQSLQYRLCKGLIEGYGRDLGVEEAFGGLLELGAEVGMGDVDELLSPFPD